MAYGKQKSVTCLSGAHKRCKGACHHERGVRPCLCECHLGVQDIPDCIHHLYASHELSAHEANRRMLEAFHLGQLNSDSGAKRGIKTEFDGKLSVRGYHAIQNLNVATFDDYRSLPRHRVAKLRNLGRLTFNEIEQLVGREWISEAQWLRLLSSTDADSGPLTDLGTANAEAKNNVSD